MTKKHFEALASIIATSANVEQVAEKVADFAAAENNRFDRRRFMVAAGMED